jgi:DNA-binding transcriptional MerR regulator
LTKVVQVYIGQTMYTIKRAAQLTGVPETSLRTWERRYGVCVPRRSQSGYRLYDDEAIAVVSTMHRLVTEGWTPAAAAEAIRTGAIPRPRPEAAGGIDGSAGGLTRSAAETCTERFLSAAAQLDIAGIDESLDEGFGLGSFEHVVDSWLFPALTALGEGWARGEIDVAGEHAASHAVQRRLSAAFDAAGSRSRGHQVVVGLPPGSQHAFGALAFATAIRRRGLNVLYLGADLPASAWETAVTRHAARAAVLAVVTPEDRPAAVEVAELLARHTLAPLVCAGGAAAADLAAGVRELAASIGGAAEQLDQLTHGET